MSWKYEKCDSNEIQTYNHLVFKRFSQTIYLPKIASVRLYVGRVYVYELNGCGFDSCWKKFELQKFVWKNLV